MASWWDRVFKTARKAGERLYRAFHPVEQFIREVLVPVFVPTSPKFTTAADRLGEGDWVDIGMYYHGGPPAASMRHDPQKRVLFIRYPVGRVYAYQNVDTGLARGLLREGQNRQTPAGGTWVWDHLRVRGKGNRQKSRKAYKEVTGSDSLSFPGWNPFKE